METIINPRTGRKITMNGKVWKSLSPEERKQAEQHTIVTKVKTSEVSKVEVESKGEVETKAVDKPKMTQAEYIANIEKKTQEAHDRVLAIIHSRMREW
jgi:hypothetical protein